MIALLETLASFVVVLGILVFVHEFGHFAVAKSLGIGVRIFSLGFPPRAFGYRWGETEYRISAIPLGGYVLLAGDESDEDRTGKANEFLSRPRWQRLLVFAGGVVCNLVLAVAIVWGFFWLQGTEDFPSPPTVVAVAPGSPAEAAGIAMGDKILTVQGRDARNPSTFLDEIDLAPESTVEVEIERAGKALAIRLGTGVSREGGTYRGDPGWALLQEGVGPTTVLQVLPGGAAAGAGLEPGDRILAADGRKPIGEVELRGLIASSAGREVRLEVEREGRALEVVLTPKREGDRGVIGVVFRTPGVPRDLSLGSAFVEAVRWNAAQTKTIFVALRRLAKTPGTVRNFSGPIGIARLSRAAMTSVESFFFFLAIISLNLGILNLLPIPMLDGGHILILLFEGAIRRDFSMKVKQRVMQAGLAFLLLFFAIVIYFDVIKTWF